MVYWRGDPFVARRSSKHRRTLKWDASNKAKQNARDQMRASYSWLLNDMVAVHFFASSCYPEPGILPKHRSMQILLIALKQLQIVGLRELPAMHRHGQKSWGTEMLPYWGLIGFPNNHFERSIHNLYLRVKTNLLTLLGAHGRYYSQLTRASWAIKPTAFLQQIEWFVCKWGTQLSPIHLYVHQTHQCLRRGTRHEQEPLHEAIEAV